MQKLTRNNICLRDDLRDVFILQMYIKESDLHLLFQVKMCQQMKGSNKLKCKKHNCQTILGAYMASKVSLIVKYSFLGWQTNWDN